MPYGAGFFCCGKQAKRKRAAAANKEYPLAGEDWSSFDDSSDDGEGGELKLGTATAKKAKAGSAAGLEPVGGAANPYQPAPAASSKAPAAPSTPADPAAAAAFEAEDID